MATNILGIGQSALAAAQVGLGTTGHNIANAATPGYNRQVIVQGAAPAQDFGFGFLGQGTEVTTVKRIYNEYLGAQVQAAQTSKSGLDSYYAQIKQIDNLLGDPASGLAPVLQDFFNGVQDVATNPASTPARQSLLSSADALTSRFHAMASRLDEMAGGVNSQIVASVNDINTYATQIASLNDAIGRVQRTTGQPANDLLDQRDQLIVELNKEIKTTVVKQGNDGYSVFIGNGQPLVVGVATFKLGNISSPENPSKIEVAYQSRNGSLVQVGDASLVGGTLGGLVEFRSKTLEPAQNALGRVALGLAGSFNAQHQAGFDLNGVAGGAFFTMAPPQVNANGGNTGSAVIAAGIGSVNALTTSDYRLQYDGANYTLTRLSDNTATVFAAFPQTVDGINLSLSAGTAAAGDSFLIRPTAAGAPGFGVALTNTAQIAAAAQPGAIGDNRNALLLGALQTTNILDNGTSTYQGAYAQLVNQIGNKTREVEVTSSAASTMLNEAKLSLQNESGVNLDEEASNLLRYQQAYQAAGKVMQIASEMFKSLLALGQ